MILKETRGHTDFKREKKEREGEERKEGGGRKERERRGGKRKRERRGGISQGVYLICVECVVAHHGRQLHIVSQQVHIRMTES